MNNENTSILNDIDNTLENGDISVLTTNLFNFFIINGIYPLKNGITIKDLISINFSTDDIRLLLNKGILRGCTHSFCMNSNKYNYIASLTNVYEILNAIDGDEISFVSLGNIDNILYGTTTKNKITSTFKKLLDEGCPDIVSKYYDVEIDISSNIKNDYNKSFYDKYFDTACNSHAIYRYYKQLSS